MTDRVPPPSGSRRVVHAAAPVWRTAFADPVRESHIRLGGLTVAEKQAARVGLVTLFLLLGSVLFAAAWRHGTLLPLDMGARLTFVPTGLVPVTLVAFLVAWWLLTWGALAAGPVTRVAVAGLFLLTNASLGVPTSISVAGHRALTWGPDILRTAYYVVPAVLVVSALVDRFETITRVARHGFRLLLALGCAAFFLTPLWVHVTFVSLGFPAGVQNLMSGSIAELDGLLLPLVFVSGILVIDFALDVAEGVSESVRDVAPKVARWLLVALLVLKLWFELGRTFGDWVTYVADRPMAVTQTVAGLVLLTVVVGLVTRGGPTSAYEDAKERLMYGSGVALALPSVVTVLVVTLGVFWIAQFHTDEPGFVSGYPTGGVVDYGRPALSVLALVAGVLLLRRSRGPMDFELGSGLVVVGAWTLPIFLLQLADVPIEVSDALTDVLVTLAVAAYVGVRWRRLDSSAVVTLAALTVFAWLAMSKGDWIAFIGSLLGLPAILVVIVGIVFSLAGDAAFTAESSPRLPQGARVLLFVGYLVLSVTILHWTQISHSDSGSSSGTDTGFFLLGIPWAAWLVGRRLTRLDEGVDDDLDGIADAEQSHEAPEMH